jgi:prepilin peptidase CpaA
MSHLVLVSTTVLSAAIAAVIDWRSGRIPNPLTFSTLLLGLILNAVLGGVTGLVESLIGLVVCAAVPGSVYWASRGAGIGGGDLKLFAAFGALLGPMQGLEVELSSFLLLGIFALFRFAYLGKLWSTLLGASKITFGLLVPMRNARVVTATVALTEMRMGPAIFAAVLTVLGLPHLMRALPWLG